MRCRAPARTVNSMGLKLTCAHCGDRIGVYEPFVVLDPDGRARRSSYFGTREAPEGARAGCLVVHTTCSQMRPATT